MNAVIYYSNTAQSKAIAQYLSEKLEYPLVNIEGNKSDSYKNAVLVFPVLCQNIPDTVKTFLKTVDVECLTVIATYGKMCRGNVLWEIQNGYKQNVVAAAYVPTKHAYIENDSQFCDYNKLSALIQKIKQPSAIKLPKLYKNPFASLFPKQRSRAGIKIYTTANCNGCNICGERCSLNAINYGVTNSDCIRCLRCIDICPEHALKFKARLPLKLYLKKKKQNDLIIYV